MLRQPHRSHGVDCERTVHPAGQTSGVARRQIMTTGEHGHKCTRGDGGIEDAVGERAAGMTRHDDVAGRELELRDLLLDEGDAMGQALPRMDHRVMQGAAGRRDSGVEDHRLTGRVVEDEHEMGEKPVAARDIDHPAAATQSPHPSRNLPRLEQLLAWQTSGGTHGPADAIDEPAAGEPAEIVMCEAGARSAGERHTPQDSQTLANSQLPTSKGCRYFGIELGIGSWEFY